MTKIDLLTRIVGGLAGVLVRAWQRRMRRLGLRVPSRPGAVGRNAPCPCGSGKKHKACCL